MAIFVRYRTIIAVLLLLLYAWVAMPVQWWHHHVNIGQAAKAFTNNSPTDESGQISKHHTTSFTDDCPICAHQYATHDGIAFSITIASPVIHPVFQTAHKTCWPSISTDLFSNKGPPALI